MAKNVRKASRSEIKKDLHDQLDRNGTLGKYFLSLVDDYMDLWDIQKKLKADIKKRGVSIYWCNGGGQEGYKKNDSVDQLNKVNAQMLKILSELGLKPGKQEPNGGGGNDEM